MKATLEFTLPDEYSELQCALHASDYKIALEEFSQYLRGLDKHEAHTQFKDTADMAQKIREYFYEITEGLDLV